MNKELIRKYKAEFDHWLDEGKLLQKQINLAIPAKWEEFLEDWDWPIDELAVIINDEYVEFRKALAEGKTVQYYECIYQHEMCVNLDRYDWLDWKSATPSSSFTKTLKYRIKPEEPKFKVGDWLIEIHSGSYAKVLEVFTQEVRVKLYDCNSIITTENTDFKLWKPQLGKWCWFSNDRSYDTPCLRKFITIIDDTYIALNSQNSSRITPTEVPSFVKGISDSYVTYKNCEPFIGQLPSYLKE